MRYIDKYIRHAEAHAINVGYLKDCYKHNISHPVPSPDNPHSSYDDFKKPEYRDGVSGWKELLLSEQTIMAAPRCCYCMRRLNPSSGRINYEHIIPRAVKGDEGQSQYKYYASHASALRDHVMMADKFVEKTFSTVGDIERETHMPHTTGLSNLVVACNGIRDTFNSVGCCCNGNRKEDKILPIMLMEKAETDVRYDENGLLSILCNDGTLDKIIQELNAETLLEIRSVWYHLSRVNVDICHAETLSKIGRINWFKEAYGTDDFSSLPKEVKKYSSVLDASNADTYWKLLLAYDWFYHYSGYAKQRKSS